MPVADNAVCLWLGSRGLVVPIYLAVRMTDNRYFETAAAPANECIRHHQDTYLLLQDAGLLS